MSDDLFKLAREIRKRNKALPKKVSKITQAVATTMLHHLVNNTPVDTTQALSNWQVNIGSPIGTTRGPYFAGRFGLTKAASVAAAMEAGTLGIKYHKPGEPIHLTNNLNYIRGLENGTISRQPGAFVRGSIVKGKAKLKRSKLRF